MERIEDVFEEKRKISEIDKALEEVQVRLDRLEALSNYDGQDKVISSIEMADYIHGLAKDRQEVTMKSGIPALDNYIHAFYGGELTIISGETGQGKTLTAQSFTYEFYKQNQPCLWFTYEVQPEQFLKQFHTPIPIFYMPMELKAKSLRWIEDRILEAKLKYQVTSVFVDHLHFLIDLHKGSNMSLEIGFVMRELKRLALKYNIAFFLLAHTNRMRLEGEPDVDSLRDSAMIGCEADNVFFVWRRKGTDNQAVLKIAKNRRFGIMGKKITLQKQGKYLVEVTNDQNYQDR